MQIHFMRSNELLQETSPGAVKPGAKEFKVEIVEAPSI
jgi:hypothetical protein